MTINCILFAKIIKLCGPYIILIENQPITQSYESAKSKYHLKGYKPQQHVVSIYAMKIFLIDERINVDLYSSFFVCETVYCTNRNCDRC